MRGVFEFTGFAGLALALHVAAFQGLPQGSESAGSGGDALLTVAAVSGSLTDMVAIWDRPPDVAEIVPVAMPQPVADATVSPSLPQSITQVPRAVVPRPIAPVLPEREDALTRDVTASPELPPAPQTKTPPKIRPEARPVAAAVKPKPATKPAPQDSPRDASTAAGRGAASARGTSGAAEATSLTKAARQSLVAEWGAKIRNRIDRAKPQGAGRGSVTVVLTVRRDGALQSVGIAASSGRAALDGMAVQAVRSAGRLPAAPAGLAEASYTFRLPIRFN